jgi:hypothetical protein
MDHPEAMRLAQECFDRALWELRSAVALLRGPDVDSSPEAMRTETMLSRAIEALSTQGFAAPQRKK